jgi:hypothetical protein
VSETREGKRRAWHGWTVDSVDRGAAEERRGEERSGAIAKQGREFGRIREERESEANKPGRRRGREKVVDSEGCYCEEEEEEEEEEEMAEERRGWIPCISSVKFGAEVPFTTFCRHSSLEHSLIHSLIRH